MEDEDLQQERSQALTSESVQRRVENWLIRIRELYGQMVPWAEKHGWHVSEVAPVPMHEELMQKFNVTEVQQPALRLETSAGKYVFFKPKALWVIGANGRIDLYTSQGTFIVVDLAEQFQRPIWKVFGLKGHPKGVQLTPDLLLELV